MQTLTRLVVRIMFHRELAGVLAIEQHNRGRKWTAEDFQPAFHDPGVQAWVAEFNGGIVGHLVFRRERQEATLEHVAVALYWRRQGVARTLLKHLKERELRCLHAVVPETNLAAQLLLRAAGFKASQVLRAYFQEEDGYVMEWRSG